MTLGRVRSVATVGVTGVAVDIEADVTSGLPAIRLVGLADRAVNEAIDRVRSAITNTGFTFPSQRITISLSPAALPKSGSTFDLPIAMACLVANGVVAEANVAATVFLGELSLDGRLRPTAGVLPGVMAARSLGATRVIVPLANVSEAELVSAIDVVGVASLRQAAIVSGAQVSDIDVEPLLHGRGTTDGEPETTTARADLSDVVGARDAIEALIVAAVGGHNILMIGPPGTGKTMIASRLPGILPPLTDEQALEVAKVSSLVDGAKRAVALNRTPPFQAPHHTLSAAGMVGGGPGVLRPGVIVRAHHGVLFLDEAPEFATNVLDCLRQPLESGKVSLQRAAFSVEYPSDFQLVMAANPCPCGQAMSDQRVSCTCTSAQRRRYLSRLSGPLMDRVDIHLTVPRATTVSRDEHEPLVTSEQARQRVAHARAASTARWGLVTNARVDGTRLRSAQYRLPPKTTHVVDEALRRGALSLRGYDRVLRIGWSLADLDGSTMPTKEHIGRALFLRKGITP